MLRYSSLEAFRGMPFRADFAFQAKIFLDNFACAQIYLVMRIRNAADINFFNFDIFKTVLVALAPLANVAL